MITCQVCGTAHAAERCPRCGTPASPGPPPPGTPADWSGAGAELPTAVAPAAAGFGEAGPPFDPYAQGPDHPAGYAPAGAYGHPSGDRPRATASGRGGRGLLLGIAAGVGAIALLGLGAGAMILLRPDSTPAPTASTSGRRTATVPGSPVAVAPAQSAGAQSAGTRTPAATTAAAPAGSGATAPVLVDSQPGVGTRQHTVTATAPDAVTPGSSVVVWISAVHGGGPTRAHTYPYQVVPAGQTRAVTVQLGDEGPADLGAAYVVEACTVSGTALQLSQAYLSALAEHSPAEVEYRKTGIDLTGYAADYACPSRVALQRTA